MDFIYDPYRFKTDDSELWYKLLLNANNIDKNLYGILNYLRDVGAVLEKSEKFGYVIKPIIGRDNWESKQQYDNEAKYLVPYKDTLIQLLKEL